MESLYRSSRSRNRTAETLYRSFSLRPGPGPGPGPAPEPRSPRVFRHLCPKGRVIRGPPTRTLAGAYSCSNNGRETADSLNLHNFAVAFSARSIYFSFCLFSHSPTLSLSPTTPLPVVHPLTWLLPSSLRNGHRSRLPSHSTTACHSTSRPSYYSIYDSGTRWSRWTSLLFFSTGNPSCRPRLETRCHRTSHIGEGGIIKGQGVLTFRVPWVRYGSESTFLGIVSGTSPGLRASVRVCPSR